MVGQRIGSYRLIRVLGEGGMGVVYEALREDIGGSAAIKVLKIEYALQADLAARFFNEARAANLVNHPGIVKVFDYGQLPSGAAFLAMEFLEGESLYKRMQRERRLSEADTLRLGRQIASALAAAHEKQVVHRDLKPENVFIVPDAEAANGERAKILDFGIAKLATSQKGLVRTNTNMLMGTPIYMSPEQCRGSKSIDDRTDVYSFGVMLYEMLTGQTPFVGTDPGEYIGQHIYQAPPRIGSVIPNLTPALQRLVESMLQKEPQARPSMAAVARVLKEIGNFSSDVVSVRALAEAQGETVPLLRALQAKEDKPASWNVPTVHHASGSAAAAAAALPPPVQVSVDPSKVEAERVAALPAARSQDAGARSSSAAVDTADDALLDTAPGGPGEQASEGADSTSLMSPESLPKPPPEPAQSTTQPIPPVQPDWQTLNVVKGAETTENKAGLLASADPAALRRPRALPRTLRRLQAQLNRQIFHRLGIGPTAPTLRSGPTRTEVRRNRWLAVGVLLLVSTPLVALCVRQGAAPEQPVAVPDLSSPSERQRGPVDQPGQQLPPTPSSSPAPPSQPAVSSLPAEVKRALAEAQRQAEEGNTAAALKGLRSAAKRSNHAALWLEAGKYACILRNLKAANEARIRLESSGDSSASRDLTAACAQQHISLGPDGKLQIDPVE